MMPAAVRFRDTQIEGLRAGIAAALAHERDIDDPLQSNWQL
jgi:hypothetical protein